MAYGDPCLACVERVRMDLTPGCRLHGCGLLHLRRAAALPIAKMRVQRCTGIFGNEITGQGQNHISGDKEAPVKCFHIGRRQPLCFFSPRRSARSNASAAPSFSSDAVPPRMKAVTVTRGASCSSAM